MAYDNARQKSRQTLKLGMLQLMRAKPVRSITVTELCALCRLNRSTFYAHYPTIEDLIGDMHRDLFVQMQAQLRLAPDSENIRDESLLTGFLLHVCREDERFALYLRCDESNLFFRNMVDHFMALLCPPDASLEQRNSLLYHMVGSFTLLCTWIREGFPCPADSLARQIISLSSHMKRP